MMSNICIVHFNPIEKYPPVINLLQYIAEQQLTGVSVTVITTLQANGEELAIPGIDIRRVVKWQQRNRLQRILFYWQFNARALRILRKLRPGTVLYYETFSAGAPCFYKKWINRSSRLFIHYHEYTSTEEFRKGIVMNRWLHQLEGQIYSSAHWVSHTNSTRLGLFIKDQAENAPPNTYVVPNYPPGKWYGRTRGKKRNADSRLAFVYVGSLSMKTMYTREFANFVAGQPGECYWDIYSDNHEDAVKDFLAALNGDNINFKGSVAYHDLPGILPGYDIGVILYKGDTFNFRFNAPNKFFEYLAAGLNVWYPGAMEGMHVYDELNQKPFVQRMNFDSLVLPSAGEGYRVAEIPPPAYKAEDAYAGLWQSLTAPV